MKKLIFTAFAVMLLFNFNVKSQIKMNSDGKVAIGIYTPRSDYDLIMYKAFVSDLHISDLSVNYNVGVGTKWLYDNTMKITGECSGYMVKVDGDIECTNLHETSDERFKKNIQKIDSEDVMDKLMKIDGNVYEFKKRNELLQLHENKLVMFIKDTIELGQELTSLPFDESLIKQKYHYNEIITKNNMKYGVRINIPKFPGGKQYGLVAQDIKDIFPEMVSYDSTVQTYSISYSGFIPVLIEATKHQQLAIEEQEVIISKLEREVEMLKKALVKDKLKSSPLISQGEDNNTNIPVLYQNSPNPFTEATKIEYYLTDEIKKAVIYIYNMNGIQIKQIIINSLGYGSITINGSELNAGMYMYTLVADGQIIDTKWMILTK